LTPAQIAELRTTHIQTAEDLAAAPDDFVKNFRGGQSLKQKAAAFLNGADKKALEQRIAELEAALSKTQPQE
jgi:hypothetical protein